MEQPDNNVELKTVSESISNQDVSHASPKQQEIKINPNLSQEALLAELWWAIHDHKQERALLLLEKVDSKYINTISNLRVCWRGHGGGL